MGCPNASVAGGLTVSVYAVDGSRGGSGMTSNWPRFRGLRNHLQPVTAGVSEIAAAIADGDISGRTRARLGSPAVCGALRGVADVSTGAASWSGSRGGRGS